ncbi:MAG: TRAP transporter small permease subunit [Desulfobacteraceae bacterium]|nr:MAG: TRAP transporter small permease subunit [Desulfobacteraceae bacterium]
MVKGLTRFIDGVNQVTGFASALFIPALVMVTIIDVSLRYLFHAGSVAFQELEWHLYAANFVMAAGWAMLKDGHVRVDILYSVLSPKKKAAVDFFGAIIFCIPFCLVVLWSSWPFLLNSWVIREGSPDPGGLPARYVLKAMILAGFGLVLIQSVSQAIRAFLVMRAGRSEQ